MREVLGAWIKVGDFLGVRPKVVEHPSAKRPFAGGLRVRQWSGSDPLA